MMRPLPSIAVLLALTACAAPSESWVEGSLSPADAQTLADAVVSVARQRLPPANSIVAVAAPVSGIASPLPEAVADALRKAGFAVAANPEGAHPLRYMVTPFDGQTLLRVSVDSTMTAQMFAANGKGQLVPASPQSVQKGAAP